jgi:hypothetical protein
MDGEGTKRAEKWIPQALEQTHFLALCGTAEQAAEVANGRERRPSESARLMCGLKPAPTFSPHLP